MISLNLKGRCPSKSLSTLLLKSKLCNSQCCCVMSSHSSMNRLPLVSAGRPLCYTFIRHDRWSPVQRNWGCMVQEKYAFHPCNKIGYTAVWKKICNVPQIIWIGWNKPFSVIGVALGCSIQNKYINPKGWMNHSFLWRRYPNSWLKEKSSVKWA